MTPHAFLLCLGIGASKKTAKNEAAKATLHLLIPELKEKLKFGDEAGVGSEEAAKAAEEREKQGCNSIDIMNFGHKTGNETGPSSGPNSVLGHYKFRYASKLQK